MPFNPQVFDIAGGLEQGMLTGAAGLSRGLEKLTERQQQIADEERRQAKATKAARELVVAAGWMTPEQAAVKGGEDLMGFIDGRKIQDQRDRQLASDAMELYAQRSLEKRWIRDQAQRKAESEQTFQFRQDELRSRDQARQDALAEKSQALLLDMAKINQQNQQFQQTLNKPTTHFGQDIMGNPFVSLMQDGQLKVLRDKDESSLNRGDNPDGLNLKPKPAPVAKVVPFPESLRDTDSIERLQAEIAAQDKIISEAQSNPVVRTMQGGTMGFMSMPTPRTAPMYGTISDRRAAYALALQRKQELQKQLDALTKRP